VTGTEVRDARTQRGWRQVELATRLGVSQGYVSLLEGSRRPVPRRLAPRLAKMLNLSASTLPLPVESDATPLDSEAAARALGALGYAGFRYLGRRRPLNPAEVAVRVLRSRDVEARVVEALPWLLVRYPDLDWRWLVREAKADDLQNRLGFLVTVARQLAERKGESDTAQKLAVRERELEGSRLQREDAFRDAMTDAERRWLREHRPAAAAHWNVLTNLTADALADAR
jgi:transcriptional regulator with XRE-family HTH domain